MADWNKDGVEDKEQVKAWIIAKPWVAMAVGIAVGFLAHAFLF